MSKDEDAGRVGMARATTALRRQLDEERVAKVELQREVARYAMIRFQAYLLAGFAEQQAVQLVK